MSEYIFEEDALQNHTHNYMDSYAGNRGDQFMSGITDSYRSIEAHVSTSELVNDEKWNKKNGARTADETRPKNMKVVFIMKCWHQSQTTPPP